MGVWDHNLKRLAEANPQAFIDWLLSGAVFVRELSVHLNRDIYIDILYEAVFKGEIILVHVEFQRYNEKEMARRLLEYNAYATYKFNHPVVSFVVYLKNEGEVVKSPLIKKLPNGIVLWRFRFFNVKLWEVPTEQLRSTQSTGLLPLLPLTREGYRPEVVDEALNKIRQSAIDQKMKDDLLTVALTLATLALSKPEHQDWLRRRFYMYQDLIRDTLIYKLIMQDGIEQGVQQGVQQGIQQGVQQGIQQGVQQGIQQGVQQEKQEELQRFCQAVLAFVEVHYPDLISLAKARASDLTEVAEAYQLLLSVGQARSMEEARRVLEGSLPDQQS